MNSLVTAFGCISKAGLEAESKPTVERDSRDWPADPKAYQLLEQCGKGGHATVYKAVCLPLGETVAIKILDLDGDANHLADVARETHLMRRYHHPNVLPLHTSMVQGSRLWMVMPLMAVGSARSIMRQNFPKGLHEVVLATIAREALKGLAYVHANHGIHRDIKADNILLGEDGSVMLADFGVAAVLRRSVSVINLDAAAALRTTVIGTPCWMAPEVLADVDGYDSSADIWSFGITLLELAQGQVPHARQHPMRVMMSTLTGPPPGLEDNPQTGRVYSKALKQVVSLCLKKDPRERVKASELLEHRFFKQSREKQYLVNTFLAGLSPAQSPRAGAQDKGVLRGASILMSRLKSTWVFPPSSPSSSSIASSFGSSSAPAAPALAHCEHVSTAGSPHAQQPSPLCGASAAAGSTATGADCQPAELTGGRTGVEAARALAQGTGRT